MDQNNPFKSFLKLDEIFPQEKGNSPIPLHSRVEKEEKLHPKVTQQPLQVTQPYFSPNNLYAYSKILEIKNKISADIFENSKNILELNRSRRKQLLIHLEKLTGEFHKSHLEADDIKTRDLLKRWVDGYQNSNNVLQPLNEAQKEAFKLYLNEVSLFTLGLVLVYKSWSDRNIVTFTETDLENLTSKITLALKPYVSLQRENWKVVCRNLYSWYKPKKSLCNEIWNILQSLNLSQEHDNYIPSLFDQLQDVPQNNKTINGYDHRFYESFWNHYPLFINSNRSKINAFSPTFRNGAFTYYSPEHFNWYGFEASHFSLMTSEFFYLFSRPKSPHYLETGFGFEAHSKEQLSLTLNHTPSTLTSITEMGACDFASVFEETKLSPTEKTATSWELKETLESIPFYKNLKNENSNIGILQTCLSLSKIRPHGLCFWFRETPLQFSDGIQSIEFIFSKAELLSEWDFSEVTHQLPIHSTLFPKYIYLFKKELDSKKRNSHRPKKIKISGTLRSHIELPHLLSEAFESYKNEKKEFFGQWKIHSFTSTSPQEDWLTQWPEKSSQNDIDLISEMKTNTIPLGQIGIIRNINTSKDLNSPLLLHLNENKQSHTLWIGTNERSLTVSVNEPLQISKATFSVSFTSKKHKTAFQTYLLSKKIQKWLDLNVERKKNKWLITEQHLKLIPVPESLVSFLYSESSDFSQSPWQTIDEVIKKEKKLNTAELQNSIKNSHPHITNIEIYVFLAEKIFYHQEQNHSLSHVIDTAGEIHWNKILEVLPQSEKCTFKQHCDITIEGTLPSHIPIIEMNTQKNSNSYVFITEGGLFCRALFKNSSLKEIFTKCIQNYKDPTWSELCTQVILPKQPHIAEVTAEEFIQIYQGHKNEIYRLKELSESFIPL